MRRAKPSKKSARVPSLSDPATLSEMPLRLQEGMYIATLDGKLIDANPAFLEMMGASSLKELKGFEASDFFKAEVRAREMALLEKRGVIRDVELQLTRPDGEVRTVVDSAYLSVDPGTGEKYCHGIMVDITHRKDLQTQLQELSIRDPLTGCYNRRYLNTIVRQCDAVPDSEWGCIYLDIDHFKKFNDTHGHAEGDNVLVKMARYLMRHVRAEEAVIRVGGDEFLVVLCDAGEDQVKRVATRLRATAAESAPAQFSMGWAARRVGEPFELTMQRADKRLLAVRVDQRSKATRSRRGKPPQ